MKKIAAAILFLCLSQNVWSQTNPVGVSNADGNPSRIDDTSRTNEIHRLGIDFLHLSDSISLDRVLQIAKQQNKPVFVYFTAEWCLPCKFLKAEIFTEPNLHTYMNSSYINYEVDIALFAGLDLVDLYKIEHYPTLLFLNQSGKEIERIVGSTDAVTLINEAQSNFDFRKTAEPAGKGKTTKKANKL